MGPESLHADFAPPSLLYLRSISPLGSRISLREIIHLSNPRIFLLLFWWSFNQRCGVELEPTAEERKFNCLPESEPKLQIAASAPAPVPAPFLFTTVSKTFCRKKSWLLKKFL